MLAKITASPVKIISWCLYDSAAASFAIIVMTFIFSTYFTTKVAADTILGTYQWANAASLSGIIIAICSPLFGAIADHGGHHKRWLFILTMIAIIATALLWFAYPTVSAVYFTLTCVVVGTIAYELALVFYNSFLPMLAPKKYLGRISGWGWGSGYVGGILALTIALEVFVKGNWLDHASAADIRICGPFAALWYFMLSLPLFFLVPAVETVSKPFGTAVKLGFKELITTFKKMPQEKNIFLYLIAHMIYTDGLNTLFVFGGIYAAGTYGMAFEEVLLLGITINISAGLGAMLMGWVDDYLGSKFTILLSLLLMTIIGIPLLFLHQKYLFWIIACIVCLFVGPVQSASRTLMVHLIEGKEQMSTEMFGLYSLSGRITSFIGPWLFGVLTYTFNSQRAGMASILMFLLLGAVLLWPVKVTNNLSK